MVPSLALESLPGQSSVEVSGSLTLISMEIDFGSFTVNPLLRESYWPVMTHSEAGLVSCLKKLFSVFSTAWNLLFKNSYYELA